MYVIKTLNIDLYDVSFNTELKPELHIGHTTQHKGTIVSLQIFQYFNMILFFGTITHTFTMFSAGSNTNVEENIKSV